MYTVYIVKYFYSKISNYYLISSVIIIQIFLKILSKMQNKRTEVLKFEGKTVLYESKAYMNKQNKVQYLFFKCMKEWGA